MNRKKPKDPEDDPGSRGTAASVGALLLCLRNALQQAERCRIALKALNYSHARWQEIVNDVNPELRFVLQSQMLDSIVTYLKSAGRPVNRKMLVRKLYAQAAGPIQRIRQSITLNLRAGNLTLHSGDKVGLPTWKRKSTGGHA